MLMSIVSAPHSLGARIGLIALLSFSSAFCIWKSHSLRRRRLHCRHISSLPSPILNSNPKLPTKILFASHTGTSESLARLLSAQFSAHGFAADLVDPRCYEPEDLPRESLVLIVASTWENGDSPPNATFLSRWLSESAADFRVGSLMLSRCRFAVFGVGSRAYGSTFNAAARDFARWMKELGAVELVPLCEGDVDDGMLEKKFHLWSEEILRFLKEEGRFGDGVVRDEVTELAVDLEDDEEEVSEAAVDDVVDLEDIAGKAPSRKTKEELVTSNGGIKEMVTPLIRKNLEKQVLKRKLNLS